MNFLNQTACNSIIVPQTSIQLSDTVSNEAAEASFNRMVENVHGGKLKGTTLLNRKSRKAMFNF